MADGQQLEDRRIEIRRDVINSAIVSGDNNKVVIYHYHLDQQVQVNGKSSLPKLGANPYRGLAAFQVEDADVYFGREKEVDRLWNRLWNLYEQSRHDKLLPRLLPILGPSGSGKSSLARAGLLPELARRPLPGHQQTRVLIVKPGETPLEKLALILARIATGDPSPVGKTEEFRKVLEKRHEQGANDGLSFIASMLPEQDCPLVVLVDQFEEIYSPDADPNQRAAFVETLLEAAVTRKAQVSIVITLRSDFLGETQRHPKLNQIIGSDQSVFLPIMTLAELHLAIEKPAEQAGHPLDFAIVNQLVEQTKEREGALPLLQFALQRIWKELSDSNFPKSSNRDILREIGGVGGALAGEAERIYTSLNSQEQDIARRVFVGLAQIGEGTRYTRRRLEVSNLLTKQDSWEQVRKVLDEFSSPNARLITLLSTGGEEVAEVTHEALFENWKQLRIWLNGQRDLLRQRDKIEDAAEEWQKQGQKRAYLLQGRQLLDAYRFCKKQKEQIYLSEEADLLIRRSLQQQKVSRLWLLGLFVIPTLVIEATLREVNVSNLSVDVGGTDRPKERQAVFTLTQGCSRKRANRWLPAYIAERLFGNCRSLSSMDLSQANLRGFDLADANLADANLAKANLADANLTNADLRDADLADADLRDADLRNARLGSVNLSNANLKNADLEGAYIAFADLRNINLEKAFLMGADLGNTELSGANFSNANLMGAHLGGANLTDANLSNTKLNGASFGDTNFNGANFSNANLNGVNLWDAKNLTKEQLGLAKLCRTELPPSIKLDSDRNCTELESN